MPDLVIAFFGDVVGQLGRRAVASAISRLRASHGVRLFIANGENSRNGSGISPDNYRELKRSGVDVVTLGDHVYKDRLIVPFLEDAHEPIARPANLAAGAPGKRITRLALPELPPIYVLTLLGRVHMPLPSDNPFAALDRELGAIEEKDAMVVVEVHAEVTSEKQALAWYALDRWTAPTGPRVVAVVGSHTHVQTSDARVLDYALGALTDLGMSGPHRSVIGRDIRATIQAMAHQSPSPLDVASDDNRASGAIIRVDPIGRRATGIEAFQVEVKD